MQSAEMVKDVGGTGLGDKFKFNFEHGEFSVSLNSMFRRGATDEGRSMSLMIREVVWGRKCILE